MNEIVNFGDGKTVKVALIQGETGNGIDRIEKTKTDVLTDTYTIYYTNGQTTTFDVENGKGIVSIVKTDTQGLIDTYTITFNDNTTQTYTVTNGKSIVSIIKTATQGATDTYTINFNDGTTQTYTVTNGNDIESIEKTSTSGLLDTYTITLTDGTTHTFTVANGMNASNVNNLADIEPALIATKDYAVNEHLIYNEEYYIVTQPIQTGDAMVVDTNIERRKVGDEISFIANIRVENSILYLPRTGVNVRDGTLNINMFN